MSMALIPPELGGPSPVSSGSDTPALADQGKPGIILAPPFDTSSFGQAIMGAAGAAASTNVTDVTSVTPQGAAAAGSASSTLASWLGLHGPIDAIAAVLGLLLVAAGIFLFKPAREAATAAVKTAIVA